MPKGTMSYDRRNWEQYKRTMAKFTASMLMKVAVFVVTWNEQIMLPQFVAHYRRVLGAGTDIFVVDNESSDATRTIARLLGCRVRVFRSDGLRDDINSLIKSTEWVPHRRKYDWVIVCDCDEFVDVSPELLMRASKKGFTVISTQGYDMVGNRGTDTSVITRGVRATGEDKPIVIDPSAITGCEFAPGAHTAKFHGRVSIWRHGCVLRHFKFINPAYVVARYAALRERRSPLNRKKTWGGQYEMPASDVLLHHRRMLRAARVVK